MPSETFHAGHHGSQPGEQPAESTLTLPPELTLEGDYRSTTDFNNVDASLFEDASESPTAETIESSAVKQPRRVRNQMNGAGEERLTRSADNALEWVPIDPSERGDVQTEVLEHVVGDLDSVKAENIQLTEKVADLEQKLAEMERRFAEFTGGVAPAQESEDSTETLGVELESTSEDGVDAEESTLDDSAEVLEADEAEVENEDEVGIEIDQSFQDAITEARDKYAELSAAHRDGYVGRLLTNSKFLVKIPIIAKLRDSQNEKRYAELDAARETYKNAVLALQHEVMDQALEINGTGVESVRYARQLAGEVATESEANFEIKLAAERMKNAGESNKVVDWWVRQEGFLGKLKKAGVVAAGGITVGALAAAAGAPLLGVAVAGVGAVRFGTWLNTKRANGITEKGGTVTLAEKQRNEATQAKNEYAQQASESEDGFVSIDQLTKLTDERTEKEKSGNRGRVTKIVSAAVAGANVGAQGFELAREGVSNLADAANQANQAPAARVAEAPLDIPRAPETFGTSFDIQPGSSFTQELMEFAGANGHGLTPDQSFDLHKELLQNFGTYIQDPSGVAIDTYGQGTDIRIAGAGGGQWAPGVTEYVQNWMTARGL